MKKNIKYITAGLLIIIVIVIVVYGRKSPNSSPNEQNITENTQNSTTGTEPVAAQNNVATQTKPVAKPKPVVSAPIISKSAPQSYVDASAKYKKSGYYIQFYPCQATPGSLIVKQGSKIMLDNRDAKAHSIGIKNEKYLIASYNYAIATLNTIGTNYVTCDGGGSATITVVP
jgi:hypothetical protein